MENNIKNEIDDFLINILEVELIQILDKYNFNDKVKLILNSNNNFYGEPVCFSSYDIVVLENINEDDYGIVLKFSLLDKSLIIDIQRGDSTPVFYLEIMKNLYDDNLINYLYIVKENMILLLMEIFEN